MSLRILVASVFAASGSIAPFYTLFLRDSGFSAMETGTVVSLTRFVSLIASPIICGYSTTYGSRRLVRDLALFSAILTFFCIPVIAINKVLLSCILFILAAVSSAKSALVDCVVVEESSHIEDYSGFRLWGSVSWGLVGVAVGLILSRGVPAGLTVLLCHGSCMLMLACAATQTSAGFAAHGTKETVPSLRSMISFFLFILSRRRVLIVTIAVFIFGLGESVVSNVFFPYLRRKEVSPLVFSYLLWADAGAEVLSFASIRFLVAKGMRPSQMVFCSCLCGAIKTLAYAMSPRGWEIVEPLHGVYFSFFWYPMIEFYTAVGASEHVPRAIALAILWSFYNSIPSLFGGVVAGALEELCGVVATLQMASVSIVVAGAIFFFSDINSSQESSSVQTE